MKKFLCVNRINSKQVCETIASISEYITSNGGTCDTYTLPENSVDLSLPMETDPECILTVGGDGTLIWAASATSDYDVPLVGINCGHLGYLCDIDTDTLEDSLSALMTDSFTMESRMMLEGAIDGGELHTALNDIVITGANGQSVINLAVEVNGSYLYSYDCDGILFATPTGSTAYNMSANGPIVNPAAQCILLTPINAHSLNSRSIVLDRKDRIRVTINPRRENVVEQAKVSFDGRCAGYLKEGVYLDIERSTKTTSMISLSNTSFLDRIRLRMNSI